MLNCDKRCFFTGHRSLPLAAADRLKYLLSQEIARMISGGINEFICGGAVGFDMLAAEAVIKIKEDFPNVRLRIALPCPYHYRGWKESDKARLDAVLSACDETILVSPSYSSGCMQMRNRFMVDSSKYGIAFLSKRSGGTWYTVKYAVASGKSIVNLADKMWENVPF